MSDSSSSFYSVDSRTGHRCKFEAVCKDQQIRLQMAFAEIDKQKQQINLLQEKIKDMENLKAQEEAQNIRISAEQNKLQKGKFDKLIQQLTEIKDQKDIFEKRCSELNSDNIRLVQILQKQKAKLQSLKSYIIESEKNKETLMDQQAEETINLLRSKLSSTKEKLKELESQNNQLTQELQIKDAKGSTEINAAIQSLQNSVDSVTKENARLQLKADKYKNMKQQYEEMKIKADKLQNDLTRYTDVDNRLKSSDSTVESLQKVIDALRTENNLLKSKLENIPYQKLQSELIEIRFERDSLLTDLKKCEEKLSKKTDLESQNAELTKKVDELFQRLKDAAQRETDLSAKLQRQMTENGEILAVRRELASIQEELVEKEKKDAKVAEQICFYKSENKKLRNRVLQLEKYINREKSEKTEEKTVESSKKPGDGREITKTTTHIVETVQKHHRHRSHSKDQK